MKFQAINKILQNLTNANYVQFEPCEPSADVPNNSIFLNSSTGIISYKNESGTVYSIYGSNGKCKIGSFTGDGTSNKSITGVGFRPRMVWMYAQTTSFGWGLCIKNDNDTTGSMLDQSYGGTWATYSTGMIKSLDADGFTVGNTYYSNQSGISYVYMCISD